MDQKEFEIESTTHVYHLALDIGGNFHFFNLDSIFTVSSSNVC